LALTATATPKVKEDIITNWDLMNLKFSKNHLLENIAYIFEVEDKLFRIEQILRKNPILHHIC
jgi:ATP-dependent DNA helicase RecQ